MRFVVVVAVVLLACKGDPNEELTTPQLQELADTNCPVVAHPYLFRVEKDGQTAYLLGTRHIGVGIAKFPRSVVDLIDTARLIVFETPRDTAKGQLPPNLPLAGATLGPEQWKRFRELAGPSIADRVVSRPLLVALLNMLLRYEDVTHMLERELWDEAQKFNIPSAGLETDAFQATTLANVMDVRFTRMVLDQTMGPVALRRTSSRDLHDYCEGTDRPPFDDDGRDDMLAAGYTAAEIASFEDIMVYSRNRTWIPKLEEMFATGGVFVAVGAAHLRGDKSVPALLRARGYVVTRID
jgi:uncharacterized protein YbaP (TraB family)